MYRLIAFTGETKLPLFEPFINFSFRSGMSSVYIPHLLFMSIVITNINWNTIHYTEKKAGKFNNNKN